MALFRMAFFRLFALIFRHFAWRISFFRLFAWRYFVFSLFRLAFFRYFVFSLCVISSWRRAITPGEKTKERNNEMAQTSHHILAIFQCTIANKIDSVCWVRDLSFDIWHKILSRVCGWSYERLFITYRTLCVIILSY